MALRAGIDSVQRSLCRHCASFAPLPLPCNVVRQSTARPMHGFDDILGVLVDGTHSSGLLA